ncbi:hypothetical protein [Maribacter sp. 2308TA10-17]|uniref:hypothetical protein n=1 Tax=Maribacter sp. 2308TA10-17 TaxID=3386276 RepID=UPI0039BC35C3
MNDNLNMALRSEVLRNSLKIESVVNSLLLSYLAIFDKERTKNFGNKAGIPFKSKIDLLFDLNILSKEEHFNLELQMIFRNKFLHDLEFNSFTYGIGKMNNSVVNKLKKFIEDEKGIDTEEKYTTAYSNLCFNNAKILSDKINERMGKIKKKSILLHGLMDSIGTTNTLSTNLVSDIFKILENSELEDPKVLKLSESIFKVCKEFTDEMESNSILKKNIETMKGTTDQEVIDLLK